MSILFNMAGHGMMTVNARGAIDGVVSRQAAFLSGRHDIIVFGYLDDPPPGIEIVPCTRRNYLSFKGLPFQMLFLGLGIPHMLKIRADVVVSTHPRNLALSFLYSRIKGVPLICWELDHDIWTGAKGTMPRLNKWVVRRAQRVVTESAEQARRIESAGVRPGRIAVIPITVDTGVFSPGHGGGGDPYLLYVAKWVSRKNHSMLITAFSRLLAEFPSLRLRIIGPVSSAYSSPPGAMPTPYFLECRDLIRLLGVGASVDLQEAVSEEELVDAYRGCCLFVFPSSEEAFGLALLEAMACGCACISNAAAPLPEVLGDAGVLLETCDADSISREALRLLRDADSRRLMGHRARERVESEFDPDTAHEAFERELDGAAAVGERQSRVARLKHAAVRWRKRSLIALFPVLERLGVHAVVADYYSPVPSLEAVTRAAGGRSTAMPGVRIDEAAQMELLAGFARDFSGEYAALLSERSRYDRSSGSFRPVDAAITYSMIRSRKPGRIVEVGSGDSSRVIAEALKANACEGRTAGYTIIDPYPSRGTLALGEVTELVQRKVEECDPDIFQGLGEDDLLFIDTSHVVKAAGDVVFEYLEVLPRLAAGVIVHIHDIYLPDDYPADLFLRGYFLSEQYLLQAFLAFNGEFVVLWGTHMIAARHPEVLAQAIYGAGPLDTNLECSFWIQRKPEGSGT